MVRLCRPGDDSPRSTPKIISSPRTMNAITVNTLISANQNSASPKPFTEMALSRNMSARNSALHVTPGAAWEPVLHHQLRGRQFDGDGHGPVVPIVPAQREAEALV